VTLRAPTDLVTDVALGQVDVTFADGSGKRRVLTLDPLPTVSCVAGERDYYASFDESVYKRGDRFEAIGRLKQEVARKLDAGERKAAEADVSSFLTRFRTEQSRAFGDASPEDAAEVEALLDTVSAPAAATPEVQNELSKKLLEEGRDSRRQGSKRR